MSRGVFVSVAVAVIATAGVAVAEVCWDRLSLGSGVEARLIGETLVTMDEQGRDHVIGVYRLTNGKNMRIDCSGQSTSHVMLGESA